MMTAMGALLFGVLAGFGVAVCVGWRINAARAASPKAGSNEFDAQVGPERSARDGDGGGMLVVWIILSAIYTAGVITQPVLFWLLGWGR